MLWLNVSGDSSPSMKQESTVKKRRAKVEEVATRLTIHLSVRFRAERKFKLNIQPATWLTSTGNEREICVFNDN